MIENAETLRGAKNNPYIVGVPTDWDMGNPHHARRLFEELSDIGPGWSIDKVEPHGEGQAVHLIRAEKLSVRLPRDVREDDQAIRELVRKGYPGYALTEVVGRDAVITLRPQAEVEWEAAMRPIPTEALLAEIDRRSAG